MNKAALYLWVFVLFSGFCCAHDHDQFDHDVLRCATDEINDAVAASDPAVAGRRQEIEDFGAQRFAAGDIKKDKQRTVKIDVVVNVVYHTEDENISKKQIKSQIAVLNDDYNTKNADLSLIEGTIFDDIVGGFNIKFNLFTIRRQQTSVEAFDPIYINSDFFEMKLSENGLEALDPETKLNIWVCPLAHNLGGYGFFPGMIPNEYVFLDGVVINSGNFGSADYEPADAADRFYLTWPGRYDVGRTATHEVGHWINLRHIWGDYYGCEEETDFVDDTPTQLSYNWYCPDYPTESCGSIDMTMNYMDYSDGRCKYAFTEGQVARGRAVFLCGGGRQAYDQNSKC